ncbi:MAG: TetR/AcrR family transcriptional regulator [Bacteroidales bacterium]
MEGTKDKILEKALDMFGLRGYDSVSIRNLTKEVGIRESSFYNHYTSKEALLDEIFRIMEMELGKNKLNAVQIDRLTDELDLANYLKKGIDRFMEKWNKPFASKVWAVVSMEQYRNSKAARIILTETERTINMLSTAFLFFQQKKKMKEGDPALYAHLYGFSIRAIHLDYSLRMFLNENPEKSLKKMYETAELFASAYGM